MLTGVANRMRSASMPPVLQEKHGFAGPLKSLASLVTGRSI